MAERAVPDRDLIARFLGAVEAMPSASEVERITGISADSVTRFRAGTFKQLSRQMRSKLAEYLRGNGAKPEPLAVGGFAEGARWGYVRAARDLLDRALDSDGPAERAGNGAPSAPVGPLTRPLLTAEEVLGDEAAVHDAIARAEETRRPSRDNPKRRPLPVVRKGQRKK